MQSRDKIRGQSHRMMSWPDEYLAARWQQFAHRMYRRGYTRLLDLGPLERLEHDSFVAERLRRGSQLRLFD